MKNNEMKLIGQCAKRDIDTLMENAVRGTKPVMMVRNYTRSHVRKNKETVNFTDIATTDLFTQEQIEQHKGKLVCNIKSKSKAMFGIARNIALINGKENRCKGFAKLQVSVPTKGVITSWFLNKDIRELHPLKFIHLIFEDHQLLMRIVNCIKAHDPQLIDDINKKIVDNIDDLTIDRI